MDQTTDALNEATPVPVEEELPVDVDQLKADIEATRDELTSTINAIQDKIDPRKVAQRAGDQVFDKARETSEKVAETAKSVGHTLSETVGDKAPAAAKTIQAKGTKLARKIRDNPRTLAYASAALGAVFVLIGVGRTRR